MQTNEQQNQAGDGAGVAAPEGGAQGGSAQGGGKAAPIGSDSDRMARAAAFLGGGKKDTPKGDNSNSAGGAQGGEQKGQNSNGAGAQQTPQGDNSNSAGGAQGGEPPVGNNNTSSSPNTDPYEPLLKEYGIGKPEDLKSWLDKGKERDILQKSIEELNSKLASKAFANDYIEKLNALYAENASPEKIKAFEKVNALGDLRKADEIEVKKLALQFSKGLTPEEAERIVQLKYNLDPDKFTEDDIRDGKLLLKMEIEDDIKILENHIASTTSGLGEAEKLKNANLQKRSEVIDTLIPQLVSNFEKITDLNINGKKGDEAIIMPEFIIPESTRKLGPALIKDYMNNNNLEVTAENLKQASEYAKDMMAFAHFNEIVVSAANHLASIERKQVLERYNIREELDRNNNAQRGSMQDLSPLDKFKKKRMEGDN